MRGVADGSPGLDGQGLSRAVQRHRLGPGLLHHQRRRRHRRHACGPGIAADRPQGAGRRPAQPRAEPARADPLLRHPAHARRAAVRRLPAGDRGERLQGDLPRRVPDQGQPAAPRRRGADGVRPPLQPRDRGRLQARAAGRARAPGEPRGADPVQRLQGPRLHRDGSPRPEARAPGRDHDGPRRASWTRSWRPPPSWTCGR